MPIIFYYASSSIGLSLDKIKWKELRIRNSIFSKKTKDESTTYDTMSSLSHTKWNCKYHIVFAPKYRRMVIYGKTRKDIGVIIRRLCEYMIKAIWNKGR